ncbi:sensor histidine kinase [Amorphus orientalis]|uniref:Blue-light-activated histidine kinase n=1 Tax=Amorphus orientalis TaxID=649198 RepID=A0AAE4ATJ5_9HYPH|nr:HWE histidine kinase domain-containing protein [Amorphus orientalis]MDQ0316363.1 PAS domain S-box-containing protein [Amorphus orientalis]
MWRPDLVALHAVSDTAIAFAYLAIPLAILALARRRRDFTGDTGHVVVLFCAFILACAVTHIGGVLTLWYPAYGLYGLSKAATALISIIAAVILWRLLPTLTRLPSISEMETINRQLLAEVEARKQAYQELEEIKGHLEEQVSARTAELDQIKQLYDAATSGAHITVFAQDESLRYTWVHNPRLGLRTEDVVGHVDADIVPEGPLEIIAEHKQRALETGEPVNFEVEVPEAGGSVWFRMDVTPVLGPGGEVTGLVGTAIDITRAKRLESMRADLSRRLSATVQRFNLALRSSEILVFSQDRDLRYTWSNWSADYGGPAIGKTDDDLYEEPERTAIIALKRAAMESGEAQSEEVRVKMGDAHYWYVLTVEPDFAPDGELRGVICAAVDITERKDHEQRMRLVMRELSHRSKNLLAVVQAIARQTAQQADTVREFLEKFGDRVRALAAAQDLLVAGNWSGASLADVVSGQLGHYVPEDGSRVIVQGPDVQLSPDAMQTLSLALHELATNAAKYGALSNETGTVHVEWDVDTSADVLDLSWREEGGPPVSEPSRRGFGRIVIERNMARSLSADVELAFEPTGLRGRFRIPLTQIRARATPELESSPLLS